MPEFIRELAQFREELSETYKLKEEVVQLGGATFGIQTVANGDELFDKLIAKGNQDHAFQDEQIPYWVDLWPSALGLGKYLMEEADWFSKDLTVLEIGCGLGLPGLVAARKGAAVCLTDYLPEPLSLARLNGGLNLGYWPQTAILDWRNPQSHTPVDVLLASDVAYEARAFEPLVQAFHALVKPGGRVLLSEPGRRMAREFTNQLDQQGFQVKHKLLNVPFHGRLHPIHIYELQFPA
ncbi:MAG: methyltransferase domain-containing protein [Bacteroidota bacterium]